MPLLPPLVALEKGRWVKLICGASYQDLPAIRNLVLVYSLAGVHCIDGAADLAVLGAIREGMAAARRWRESQNLPAQGDPWLMVSLNDGEDPHFRKAVFDPRHCPPACPRPCEAVCPAQAINHQGVIEHKCYGCGRCLPVCPLGLIGAEARQIRPAEVLPWLEAGLVDAVELHTQTGREREFQILWTQLRPGAENLKLLSVSCPYHPEVLGYLQKIYPILNPLPLPLIWQTDGRPMSGDIGKGATQPAIRFAQGVLNAGLPGFIQLAGGVNAHTVPKLKELGLLNGAGPFVNGLAYGSYARVLLQDLLPETEPLERYPDRLKMALERAGQISAISE
ncbi:MAG: circadian clock protein LdpA [Cyanobacteriota bacterium]|jgi:Fe-S-cluster-containing hydrogenase component 2